MTDEFELEASISSFNWVEGEWYGQGVIEVPTPERFDVEVSMTRDGETIMFELVDKETAKEEIEAMEEDR